MKVSAKNVQVDFHALLMQDRPTFGALSNRALCHLYSVANITKSLSEKKYSNKKHFLVYGENPYHTISIYRRMFIIEISYNFLYEWNCMKRSFPFLRIV